jgi:Uma2 family endonuclease
MTEVADEVTSLAELPQHVLLEGITWEVYDKLLRQVDGQNLRLTYDSGELEIMSPLPEHEYWSTVFGRMIEIMSLELGISMYPLGSTTFRQKQLQKGLEPDECYYVANEPAVRGKRRLDLRRDPPPDLVVEIDITHLAVDREKIYAAMGVPEIWRFDGRRLACLHLANAGGGRQGKRRVYREAEKSLCFPFLRPADLMRFLKKLPDADQLPVMRAFRDWVIREFKR